MEKNTNMILSDEIDDGSFNDSSSDMSFDDNIIQVQPDELETLQTLFLTSEKFYKDVDDMVWKDDISYLEAIMLVCDEKDINPEDLEPLRLISPLLKQHLIEEETASGRLKPASHIELF